MTVVENEPNFDDELLRQRTDRELAEDKFFRCIIAIGNVCTSVDVQTLTDFLKINFFQVNGHKVVADLSGKNAKSVLLMYENEELARLALSNLQKAQYCVFTFCSGSGLLKYCREVEPQLSLGSRIVEISDFNSIALDEKIIQIYEKFGTISYMEYRRYDNVSKARIEYTRATSAFIAVLKTSGSFGPESVVKEEEPIFPTAIIGGFGHARRRSTYPDLRPICIQNNSQFYQATDTFGHDASYNMPPPLPADFIQSIMQQITGPQPDANDDASDTFENGNVPDYSLQPGILTQSSNMVVGSPLLLPKNVAMSSFEIPSMPLSSNESFSLNMPEIFACSQSITHELNGTRVLTRRFAGPEDEEHVSVTTDRFNYTKTCVMHCSSPGVASNFNVASKQLSREFVFKCLTKIVKRFFDARERN